MKQTIIVLAFIAVPFTSFAALIPADINAPVITPTVVAIPQENDGGTPVVVTNSNSGFSGFQGERTGCLTYWPGTQVHTPCFYEVQATILMLAGLTK